MSKGLEELKRLAYENACCRCQYYIDKKCTNKHECIWLDIEQELKEYEQYKAIEKELGISLVTLFKASKNGVYVKETQYSRRADYVDGASLGFGHNSFYFYDAKNRLWNMFFKDYGKTWALTKEELL